MSFASGHTSVTTFFLGISVRPWPRFSQRKAQTQLMCNKRKTNGIVSIGHLGLAVAQDFLPQKYFYFGTTTFAGPAREIHSSPLIQSGGRGFWSESKPTCREFKCAQAIVFEFKIAFCPLKTFFVRNVCRAAVARTGRRIRNSIVARCPEADAFMFWFKGKKHPLVYHTYLGFLPWASEVLSGLHRHDLC